MNIKRYDADNLIYNRFDIIHASDYESIRYENNSDEYEVYTHCDDGIAEINLWGKFLPDKIIDLLVNDIFTDKNIFAIEALRIRNQYHQFLEATNDVRVPLPETFDELMDRAERRDRATIRRKLRWLDKRIGSLQINVCSKEETQDSVVDTYFKWKKESHGTDYGLNPREYLDKYYVTDSIIMRAGDTDVAVAFFCQVEGIVFFENFSYNPDLKEYSPGLLMYVKLMEELIKRKCRYLYLGGGGYIYKKRFGAEHSIAYSGKIYRREIIDVLNIFFVDKGIKTVAFYGYGVCGHSFYQLSKNLDIRVSFGIDKNAEENKEATEISLYLPEAELPMADAGLITLNNCNTEVYHYMKRKFSKVFYWNEILESVINDYRKSVDAVP